MVKNSSANRTGGINEVAVESFIIACISVVFFILGSLLPFVVPVIAFVFYIPGGTFCALSICLGIFALVDLRKTSTTGLIFAILAFVLNVAEIALFAVTTVTSLVTLM